MFSSWQEERPRKLFSGAAASSRRQRGDHRRAGLQRQRGAGPRPGAVRVHSSFIRTCWTSEERSEPIYDQSLLLLLWFLWGSSSISAFTVRTGPIQLHKARGSIHWIAMTSIMTSLNYIPKIWVIERKALWEARKWVLPSDSHNILLFGRKLTKWS